jgi:uncharacterized Zn-finger protein
LVTITFSSPNNEKKGRDTTAAGGHVAQAFAEPAAPRKECRTYRERDSSCNTLAAQVEKSGPSHDLGHPRIFCDLHYISADFR